MLRVVLVVCALSTSVLAQPRIVQPRVAITAVPAPSPSTLPSPLPPPPPNAPPVDPSTAAPSPKPSPRTDRFLVALGLSGCAIVRGLPDDRRSFRRYAAATLELGVTILPILRVRVFGVLLGTTIGVEPRSELERIGLGLEARTCTSSGDTCVFGGVDVAQQEIMYLHADGSSTYEGSAVGPRLGVERGGRHVRMRVALELYHQFGIPDGSLDTLGVSLAVGYQL